jgi:hypothetical protein
MFADNFTDFLPPVLSTFLKSLSLGSIPINTFPCPKASQLPPNNVDGWFGFTLI